MTSYNIYFISTCLQAYRAELFISDEAVELARMAAVNLERRAAVRESREAIRQLVNLKELQHHFVSYRSKVATF